jgi:hypothetical protein
MRRYLEQQNIRVLPESGYYPPQALQERLQADMEQTDLYVQLLSSAVGMGNPDFLFQCAQESKKPILLWHP